jgi:hypothetical protein
MIIMARVDGFVHSFDDNDDMTVENSSKNDDDGSEWKQQNR